MAAQWGPAPSTMHVGSDVWDPARVLRELVRAQEWVNQKLWFWEESLRTNQGKGVFDILSRSRSEELSLESFSQALPFRSRTIASASP